MKERPIIFSGEMVRAILDGRKTQTRRPIKPQPPEKYNEMLWATFGPRWTFDHPEHGLGWEMWPNEFMKCPYGMLGDCLYPPGEYCEKLTLEITDVRVERVQDISVSDAKAEGMSNLYKDDRLNDYWAIKRFQRLWNSIYDKTEYTWEKNPWVWAITYKLINPQR